MLDRFVLDSNDIVAGGEGTATAVIDGRVVELFEVKDLQATVEINKEDKKTLGKRAVQKKATGWNGTGTLTMYLVTSRWNKMLVEYIKNGRLPKFTINVKNQDPSSNTGREVKRLAGCMIDGAAIAQLNAENDGLEQEINFTFEDADLLEEFKELN